MTSMLPQSYQHHHHSHHNPQLHRSAHDTAAPSFSIDLPDASSTQLSVDSVAKPSPRTPGFQQRHDQHGLVDSAQTAQGTSQPANSHRNSLGSSSHSHSNGLADGVSTMSARLPADGASRSSAGGPPPPPSQQLSHASFPPPPHLPGPPPSVDVKLNGLGSNSGIGNNNNNNNSMQKEPSDDGTNPLKRRSTADSGAVDYPRRRATIACEVCRSRKSRCDGTKPKCKLCTELGAECVYREPGIKLDAGDKLILERLNRIEGLLQMNLAAGGGGATSPGFNLAAAQQQQQQQQHQQQAQAVGQSQGSPSTLSNGGTSSGGLGSAGLPPPPPGGPNSAGGGSNTGPLTVALTGGPSSTLPIVGGGPAGIGIGVWPDQAAMAQAAAAQAAGQAHGGDFGAVLPATSLGAWASSAAAHSTNISTMPKVHTNAALHLLQWPLIRDLVSRPYDPQILLQLEMAREPLHSLTKTPCVDLSNTAAYIEAYFDRVNIWYACVNPYTWRSHYRTALSNGFREGPESCIVLLVLALGQASLRGSISRIVPHHDPPGLPYFTAAWALLPGMMTSNSVLAAQCHLLAAAYLFYLVRPLEAWNLLCTTSTKLQLLLMAPASRVPPAQRELTERIYWNALLFESDLLAELDLPHSGVVQFEENVGLPCGFEPEDRSPSSSGNGPAAASASPVGHDDLWYFLAEIALRRLLNRVSQLLYSQDSMASTTSLEPVVAELDYQLTQWYESLPQPLQFSFARSPPLPDPVQTVLRLRFFACRTIIYRPYILAVLDNEQAVLDPAVQEACHKCLEASVRQLEHISAHHAGHMPYLWQGALSIVSQTLLVMGASMSPSLSRILLAIVPHRDVLDQIITDVVVEIEKYAALAPSLRLSAEILTEAEARRRAFLSG